MLGLGLGLSDAAVRGRGASGPVLPYNAFAVFMGDSQALGTTGTPLNTSESGQQAMQAAWAAAGGDTPLIKVQNVGASTFSTYSPGTFTGNSFGASTGICGPELQFAIRWRQMYPNDPLYIVKWAYSGSFQTSGVPYTTGGAATVSITNPNTLVVNAGAVNNGDVITGTGLVNNDGKLLWKPFNGFISAVGASTNANVTTVSSVAATRYEGYKSWAPAYSLTYNGLTNATITDGFRGRLAASLSAVANSRLVFMAHVLGTNDFSNATTGGNFATELGNFWSRFQADFTTTNLKVVMPRIWSSTNSVRAAQEAFATANPKWTWVNTDDLTRWDTTHWNGAGQITLGNRLFDNFIAP